MPPDAKKRKVVVCAPPASLSDVSELQIDWSRCCLCQKGDGLLTCPHDNPVQSKLNQGYASLSSSLTELKTYNFKLDSGRSVNALDEGDGIQASFLKYKAKWHKSCALKFASTKMPALLSRLQKEIPAPPSTESEADSKEPTVRHTRSTVIPVRMKDMKCFICLGPETRTHPLCLCATKEITEKVRICATALCELRIVGLIETGGDLVAMEAKYHKNCLADIYNRHRNLSKEQPYEKQEPILCEKIAFAELVLYVENNLARNVQYIFDMGLITKSYHARLADLNKCQPEELSVEHTTRLREKLLNYFPSLVSEKWGKKYVLKSRTTNFMPNILREDQDDDVLAFHRFAKSVRKSISESKVTFDGVFLENCEENCIPGPLLAVVSTLLYGTSKMNGAAKKPEPLKTICQLIMLNFHTKQMPKGDIVRHKKHREPPLPLYLGLACYGRNRDKEFIDILHQKGMSVSSNRVTEVTSQLFRLVVQRAKDENVVCPSNLKRNIFTVTALDNIDMKSTSNTTVTEFHGTGISVFQVPTEENAGESRQFSTSFKDVARNNDRSVPDLPEFYSFVPDCTLPTERPSPPTVPDNPGILDLISTGHISAQWTKEQPWLISSREYLNDTAEHADCNFSWSAFHASQELKNMTSPRIPAISALLPLFHEKSTSVGMIKHGLDMAKKLTNYLNKN